MHSVIELAIMLNGVDCFLGSILLWYPLFYRYLDETETWILKMEAWTVFLAIYLILKGDNATLYSWLVISCIFVVFIPICRYNYIFIYYTFCCISGFVSKLKLKKPPVFSVLILDGVFIITNTNAFLYVTACLWLKFILALFHSFGNNLKPEKYRSSSSLIVQSSVEALSARIYLQEEH